MQKFTKLAIFAVSLMTSTSAWANHPVFVEGNCLVPPAGSPAAPVGNCGDFDGDGKIGFAEDNDGDRVFGTIMGALGDSGGTGVNQNGQVTIVTSGVFVGPVFITAANGNVTLQAAPGVEAVIDAVLQGDPQSTARQGRPGITVQAPGNRRVVIRNLTVRNWTTGIRVGDGSRVAIESVRVENNINYGIEVGGRAKVKVDQSQVIATGFRNSPAGDFPSSENQPAPGNGIEYSGNSTGAVFRTEVSGSFGAGISDQSGGEVTLRDVFLFDNNPNTTGFGQ